MKAMILAAGLGTRLRPLTDSRPKALVELSGRTLLEITLSRLRSFGITEVIINVHHFADMVIEYLQAHNNFGMRIEISLEENLLGTGGGLKKASWFFLEDSRRDNSSHVDVPFLLHNVDVLSTFDLPRMVQSHQENRALATLAVQHRESSRYLLFNDQLQLCGHRIAGEDTVIPVSAHVTRHSPDDTPLSQGVIPPSPDDTPISAHVTRHSPDDTPLSQGAIPLSPGVIPSVARDLLLSQPLQALAFSGIHVISPRLLPLLTEEGIFSIIDPYLRLASQGENILAFRSDDSYWRDLGKPADLTQAARDLSKGVVLG